MGRSFWLRLLNFISSIGRHFNLGDKMEEHLSLISRQFTYQIVSRIMGTELRLTDRIAIALSIKSISSCDYDMWSKPVTQFQMKSTQEQYRQVK